MSEADKKAYESQFTYHLVNIKHETVIIIFSGVLFTYHLVNIKLYIQILL